MSCELRRSTSDNTKSTIVVAIPFWPTSPPPLTHGFWQATFTSLATSGKRLSKCGICHGTMTYINTRPSRLYCDTCEAVCALDNRAPGPSRLRYACVVHDVGWLNAV